MKDLFPVIDNRRGVNKKNLRPKLQLYIDILSIECCCRGAYALKALKRKLIDWRIVPGNNLESYEPRNLPRAYLNS